MDTHKKVKTSPSVVDRITATLKDILDLIPRTFYVAKVTLQM